MRLARSIGIACMVAAFSPGTAAGDAAPHVRVRGASRIDAQGVRVDGSAMLLRGTVLDDSGAPVAKGALVFTLARASAPSKVIAPPGPVSDCATGVDASEIKVDADGATHLKTDAAGRFCVRMAAPIDKYAVQLQFAGTAFVDASSLPLAVDLARRTCTLSFTPEPKQISIDGKARAIDVTASLESDGATGVGVGLPLALSSERGALGSATTDASGHARFNVEHSKLGPPGPGELRVSFQGNADTSAASQGIAIERHARVSLDVRDAHDGELPAGAPEDGVPIAVTVRAGGGDVNGGTVEARVGDRVVGAAPVLGGTAKLVATFSVGDTNGSASETALSLRYVASAPWFEPGADSAFRLPLRGPGPWRQAPLILAGLAVAAWLVASRAERVRALARLAAKPTRAPRGEARIEVVRPTRDLHHGWRGRAVDADDDTPIAGVRVQIERPAFGRAEILASTQADDDGRFELPAISPHPADELSFDAELHVPLRRPLPPSSELDAQLVLRKRALLTRLVTWARSRGRPFDQRPDPTPAHVRRAAGDDFRVARWADAVEKAVYGGDPVDARVESDVARIAPTPAVVPPAPPSSGAGVNEHALLNPTRPNR